MISRKMLITMYDYSYYLITQQTEGISHPESLVSPAGGGNSLNWILGHIITSRCNVLAMLKLSPVWDFSRCRPYIPGSDPIPGPEEIINFESMLIDLDQTQELLMNAIARITGHQLLELIEDQSMGEQLAGYGIHEAYHAGQIEILKQNLQLE